MPINNIRASDILTMLQAICQGGTIDTAHRCRSLVGQILRFAIVTGRAESDPTTALKGAIQKADGKPMATTLDPKAIGSMMRSIESYTGTAIVRSALQMIMLTFVRPKELRFA